MRDLAVELIKGRALFGQIDNLSQMLACFEIAQSVHLKMLVIFFMFELFDIILYTAHVIKWPV